MQFAKKKFRHIENIFPKQISLALNLSAHRTRSRWRSSCSAPAGATSHSWRQRRGRRGTGGTGPAGNPRPRTAAPAQGNIPSQYGGVCFVRVCTYKTLNQRQGEYSIKTPAPRLQYLAHRKVFLQNMEDIQINNSYWLLMDSTQ